MTDATMTAIADTTPIVWTVDGVPTLESNLDKLDAGAYEFRVPALTAEELLAGVILKADTVVTHLLLIEDFFGFNFRLGSLEAYYDTDEVKQISVFQVALTGADVCYIRTFFLRALANDAANEDEFCWAMEAFHYALGVFVPGIAQEHTQGIYNAMCAMDAMFIQV